MVMGPITEPPMTRNSRFSRAVWQLMVCTVCLLPLISTAQQMPTATAGETAPAIAIGPGDLLNIVVFDTPELSASVRVNQNGEVDIPVLGLLNVAGMTANQASSRIQMELRQRKLLLDPHVTVFISEYASQGATVIGEVKTPGVYPTLGTRRLLDMISIAGGLMPTAGKAVAIIHRDDPEHPMLVAIQPNLSSINLQKNPIIEPGDTIDVSKAGVVYVIGDVLKPGGYLVDNNNRLSIIQALSLAGGWDKTAALSKTKLIRNTPRGREAISLDLKHITDGKQADIKVGDGDILFVPSSIGKTFGYRGIEAAISITSGLLIYSNQKF